MSKIHLNEDYFIAKGGEKKCFIHPNDNTKVIKVVYNKSKIGVLEDIYMRFLQKRNIDFYHLPKYYGKVDTNLGDGFVYERILNYDSSEAKSLRYYIANRVISYDLQKKLIDELGLYLEKNNILFVDNHSSNIFCQKLSSDDYRLIVIDGLGAKRLGFKFYLYLCSVMFTKYKVHKQWKRFLGQYKQDKKLIRLID